LNGFLNGFVSSFGFSAGCSRRCSSRHTCRRACRRRSRHSSAYIQTNTEMYFERHKELSGELSGELFKELSRALRARVSSDQFAVGSIGGTTDRRLSVSGWRKADSGWRVASYELPVTSCARASRHSTGAAQSVGRLDRCGDRARLAAMMIVRDRIPLADRRQR